MLSPVTYVSDDLTSFLRGSGYHLFENWPDFSTMRKFYYATFTLMAFVAYHRWTHRVSTLHTPTPLQYVVRTYNGASSDRLPMIMAFHGHGADEQDLLSIFEHLGIPLRVVSFRGTLPAGGGYTWSTDASLYDSIAAGTSTLLAKYPTQGKPILFGFSAGGKVVYESTLRHGELYAASIVVAGTRAGIPEALPTSYDPAQVSFFIYNGTSDSVVPIEESRSFAEALKTRHFNVEWRQFEGHHGVPASILPRITEDLRTAIASPSNLSNH